jgi:hypothetical protein
MANEFPQPVPLGIVEDIQALCDSSNLISFDSELHLGGGARILSGPLAGCVGNLIRMSGCDRVSVLLEIMGNRISVSVPRGALAPVA